MRNAVIIVLCLLVACITMEAVSDAYSERTPPLAKVFANE